MNEQTNAPMTLSTEESEVRALYQRVIDGWNKRSAEGMAAAYAEDGEQIGFDGSQLFGRASIEEHLRAIFEHHQPAAFVSKVKAVRFLSPEVADLRAVVGMVKAGESDLIPNVNAHQTLIATKQNGEWRVALFQNTPAQFHGRPELSEQLTAELRELLS